MAGLGAGGCAKRSDRAADIGADCQKDEAEKGGGMSMNWRKLKTGDPCPCCGQPIQLTDPDALRLLAMTADLLGLPEHSAAPKPDDIPPVRPIGARVVPWI